MRSRDDSLFGKIVDCVNVYFEENGRSPSTREIEKAVGVSRATVQRYLTALQERGEIEYDGHRGIVTPEMREMIDSNRMEIGSSIPCGPLGEVVEPTEREYIRLPIALTGPGEFFLLYANGDSMENAGIENGDKVLIRQQSTPEEGKIVACLYDNNQTTLKRFHRVSADEVHLIPENEKYQPIVIKGNDLNKLQIQGVATMVMKNL